MSGGTRASICIGLYQRATEDLRADEPAKGIHILRLFREDTGEELHGTRCIATLEQGLRFREGRCEIRPGGADNAFDEALELALGERAHETIDRLSPLEGEDRGNRLHAQLARDCGCSSMFIFTSFTLPL